MIDLESVKNILLDVKYISNIALQTNISFMGFSEGIKCDLVLKDIPIKIFIGIPENWELKLFCIYLVDYSSMPFIPHVESNGKLCLFELEGVLIDHNFSGLLLQCIERAKNILEKGLYFNNDREFVREFSSYWEKQPKVRIMKCAIPKTHKTQPIMFCDSAQNVRKKKKEKYIDYLDRVKSFEIFAASEPQYFSLWNKTETQHYGLFFYLEPSNYIIPPDPRNGISLDYVQMLLSYVNTDEVKKFVSKIRNDTLFVFEIIEPGQETVCIGIKLKNFQLFLDKEHLCITSCENSCEIIPVYVSRIDEEFLTHRTQHCKQASVSKILLIGCGSIGGYLCSELVKSGYNNLTLVDSDILKAENIYRHFLSREYVGKYKAEALRSYCLKSFPNVNIKSLDFDIEDVIDDSIDLNEFDVIISATGNHNINRWLNKKIYQDQIKTPCFYLWNEPLDIGCHLAIINYEKPGCYECFFKRDVETRALYDSTAYSKRGQIVTKNFRGCSGSFVPYSSNVSLRTALICLEWLERLFSGRCNSNYLVSIKGDAYNFRLAGYKCSNVYEEQKTKEKVLDGSSFCYKSCEVCGE